MRDLPPSRARAPACHPARSAPHPTIPCRRPRPAVGARIGSYPPCLPSSWRLTLRVRRCRRFGWRLLDFGRLHTSARARCNIGVNCPQLVARGLIRLAKLGSSLPPLKALLGALRAGSGQRGLRSHYGKPCNDWPHGSPSSRDLMVRFINTPAENCSCDGSSGAPPAQRASFLGRSIDGGC
jgi:hypothetical protein